MGPLYRRSPVLFSTIFLTFAASPQEKPPASDLPNAAILPLNAPEVLTGKERLGKKWMDEQRIDNCNVPVDKRGTKPRLSTCPHVPTVRSG
jgi:hypothetical protein